MIEYKQSCNANLRCAVLDLYSCKTLLLILNRNRFSQPHQSLDIKPGLFVFVVLFEIVASLAYTLSSSIDVFITNEPRYRNCNHPAYIVLNCTTTSTISQVYYLNTSTHIIYKLVLQRCPDFFSRPKCIAATGCLNDMFFPAFNYFSYTMSNCIHL